MDNVTSRPVDHTTDPTTLSIPTVRLVVGGRNWDTPVPEKIDIAWCDPGYTSGHFAHSIASAAADMEYFGTMGKIHRLSTSLLARGRNVLVDEFLHGDSDWLWCVDSDMAFDKGHVMKLWNTAQDEDVKIVSGLAFIFKNGDQPVPSYFIRNPDSGVLGLVYYPIPEVPMTVEATGMASVLIHRDVFFDIEPARHGDYRWFDQTVVEGKMQGEDVHFHQQAKKAGYKTVLDPNAETWHVKDIGIGRESYDRFWEMKEK